MWWSIDLHTRDAIDNPSRFLPSTSPICPSRLSSERLGHASIAITADTYSHGVPTLQSDTADLFAEAMDHPAEFVTALAARNYKMPCTDIMILSPGGKLVLV